MAQPVCHGVPNLGSFLQNFFLANCDEIGFFWLDSGSGEYAEGLGRFAFFGIRPQHRWQYNSAGRLSEWLGIQSSDTTPPMISRYVLPEAALAELERTVQHSNPALPPVYCSDGRRVPLQSGVVGSFAYEFGYLFQDYFHSRKYPLADTARASDYKFEANPSKTETLVPLQVLWDFSAYPAVLAVDLHLGEYLVTGQRDNPIFTELQRRAAAALHSSISDSKISLLSQPPGWQLESELSRSEYHNKFVQIHSYLQDGEIYQLNFSQRLRLYQETENPASLAQLYLHLRRSHPVPFGAFWRQAILCFSPERFFRLDSPGWQITARPMKGTRSRHAEPEADRCSYRELCDSPKERAELLMICDLIRNDLYHICEPQSVHCPNSGARLFQIEAYPSVWQQTVSICGKLKRQYQGQLRPLLHALFPCGSITGAPKFRAMELISLLEAGPRGWYTGNLGYIDQSGAMEFNVLIRSFQNMGVCKPSLQKQKFGLDLSYHVGGGLLWASSWEEEWTELHAKCRFFLQALGLASVIR